MIIGIIDSGIDPTHPDLSQFPGHDYVYDDIIPSDSLGHGTACAGVAAGIANNTKGVAGAAGGVSVMALRGFCCASGTIPFTNISNCITYGTTHGAKVLSMSFSFGWAFYAATVERQRRLGAERVPAPTHGEAIAP